MDDKIKMMMPPENATVTRVDSPTPGYVAVLTEQHPLDAGPVPVVKNITRETTVGKIIDWYLKRHRIAKGPVYDLRITEAT